MKKIEIWNKSLELNIGDELLVKDLRKIQPILNAREQGKELEFAITIVKSLAVNADEAETTMDNMTYDEFMTLQNSIMDLLSFEKKTKE